LLFRRHFKQKKGGWLLLEFVLYLVCWLCRTYLSILWSLIDFYFLSLSILDIVNTERENADRENI
jgi:hypothetical protein